MGARIAIARNEGSGARECVVLGLVREVGSNDAEEANELRGYA